MSQFDDVTEDLPLYYQMQPTPVSLALVNSEVESPTSTAAEADSDEEELTVVEHLPARPKRGSFYRFIISPFYPAPFSLAFVRYLGEVRTRMIESREFDKINYPHTIYQKLRRLAEKSYVHVKTNLNS